MALCAGPECRWALCATASCLVVAAVAYMSLTKTTFIRSPEAIPMPHQEHDNATIQTLMDELNKLREENVALTKQHESSKPSQAQVRLIPIRKPFLGKDDYS